MATTAGQTDSPALHIARVPGELGPVVRCSGALTVATGEALKRQLDLLTSLRLPALIVNVSGCRSLDMEGVLILVGAYKRMQQEGRRFAIVAGTETVARVFEALGIDAAIPVFATEASAVEALRGGRPEEIHRTCHAERAESLTMWRSILEALDAGSADEVWRRINSSHGLCRQGEEILKAHSARDGGRCYLCPLFHALGVHTEAVECEGITQAMLEALFKGDRGGARARVSRLIDLVETMPLPHG